MAKQGLLNHIDSFLEDISPSEKTAEANPEAGGYDGPSTHPSTQIDDDTQDATEGSRSAENEADVKADHPGAGVDHQSEATYSGGSGDQQSVTVDIGMNVAGTGEDSAVEDDYKGDKDDSGYDADTTHPADGDVGEKYSSMKTDELAKLAADLGNSIAADVIRFQTGGQAAEKAAEEAPAEATKEAAAEAGTEEKTAETNEADQAGQDAADVAAAEKVARDAQINEGIQMTIKEALADADLAGGYIRSLHEKTASEEEDESKPTGDGSGDESEGESHGSEEKPEGGSGESPNPFSEGGDAPSEEPAAEAPAEGGPPEAGGPPAAGPEGLPPEAPAAPPAPEMGGGEDPGALISAMIGGGEAPPADPMGGGAPPVDPMGAAPPADPMGGDPMGGDPMGGGGDPMMGLGVEDALTQLIMALEEMGVSLPQLAAASADQGAKLAAAADNHRKAGKFRFAEAKEGSAERAVREQLKSYVRELVN